MNIGIDARLLERRVTGIGRILMLLLKEIPKVDKKNKYFLFSYGSLDVEKNFYINVTTVKSLLPQKLFSPIWNNFILPHYLKKEKIDLLFSVNQILPLFKVKGCKYISIVNDVIYKADPNFLPFTYRKYLQFFAYFSIKISDLIITISKYSKKDILKHYKVDEKKIKVILQSANEEFMPMNLEVNEKKEIKAKLKLTKYTILYVGVIENRKNILGILKVADELKEYKDIRFLLIGKMGYGSKKIMKEVNERKNVIYRSNVDDGLLKKIYNIADVFLFPSYYEGFGYPPLEAMQSGLPVIAANNTSLAEIVDTGGLLHDPDDYISMAKNIIKLLNDNSFYMKMRNKGLERAKQFTLEKTVKETVDVFNSF
ncbi:MAG: hypothetical protein A2315_11210 [Ignavibacteria bacterium RIFOXYB2_FULL_35_12]|nr:MAG: hypothetical protein A2058_07915 [Ignavibacteria bacterium GWA2_36_19]OGU51326.1 MAG: hypothetical protein A2006_09585 [Ignavibacteria bacterium GWC2_35_8]OGU61426.1 MAG: hypothetical protein A2X60_01755 [Ignavibacteria bacterium GWF2_35_20]OGU78842.1 MAG: hypothetical protein A2254_15605 [Ignavibacteria bacterium RIFOXYA2_FULL_35_9]OGU80198.1 MAG: hypothetical protein A2W11_14735 [Ignavibacteria bacterium RBG_16_35_7]OGU85459.1 MAG: hypothetical protein A3K31_04825 [Ignavibacteria bac